MATVTPGWYPDPADPSTQRYWDGEGWIGDPLPADATPPAGPPPVAPPPPPAPVIAAPPTPEPPAPQPTPLPMPPFPPGMGRPGMGGPARPGAVRLPPPPGWPAGYPYPYPRDLPMPIPRVHGLDLASPATRLVARLIDIGIVLLLSLAVNGWFIYLLWQKAAPVWDAVWKQAQTGVVVTDVPQATGIDTLLFVIMLVGVAMWFAYEVPAVANNGQTVGKRLLGLRVMRLESTEPMGFGRAWRRWNTMALPTLLWCCGLGFVIQFVDNLYVAIDRPLRQALHDKTALTVVVKVRHNEVAEPGSHRRAEGEST